MYIHSITSLDFDYFSCIQHNVVVEKSDLEAHKGCDFVGEYFKIKAPKKKIYSGLISKKLVNKEKEKENIRKFLERKKHEDHRKELAQVRFEKQINDGDAIVNLLEMKI